MDVKDKNWESGPHQDHLDKRIEEQISRAAEEVDRRKDNLDDKGEGSKMVTRRSSLMGLKVSLN